MVRAVWLLQTLKGLIPSYSFSYPLSTSTPNQISDEMIHSLELWFVLCFFFQWENLFYIFTFHHGICFLMSSKFYVFCFVMWAYTIHISIRAPFTVGLIYSLGR